MDSLAVWPLFIAEHLSGSLLLAPFPVALFSVNRLSYTWLSRKGSS